MYYPIMMRIEGKRCLIVGGGLVAARKCSELINCGADVEVLAPSLRYELHEKCQQGKIKWIKGEYHNKYLDNISICFACTNHSDINALIAKDCSTRNILLNVADNPKIGNFVVPACRRREDIVLAVSCDENPAAARFVATRVMRYVDDKVVEYIGMTKRLRLTCKALINEGAVRQEYMKSLFADEMIEIAVKEPSEAYKAAEMMLTKLIEKAGGCNR